MFTIVYVAAQE